MNNMSVESAAKLAKPFVGSLRSKFPGSRPILKCALVTETHVIATNSHFLIRIQHNESVSEPYLYHYKKFEETESLTPKSYPTITRLFPQTDHAKDMGPVDVKEMFEAAEGAQVVCSNNQKALKERGIKTSVNVSVSPESVRVPNRHKDFLTGEYSYALDSRLPVSPDQPIFFNGEYLKTVFKTFKQAKVDRAGMYYYGPMRPVYLVGGPIEIILLPVRVY